MRLISGYELWGTPSGFSGQRVIRMDCRAIEASAFDMPEHNAARVVHGTQIWDVPYTAICEYKSNILLTVGFDDEILHWYVWELHGIEPMLLGAWCAVGQQGVPDYVTKAHAMGVAAGYSQPVFVLLDRNKEPSYYID